MERLFSVQQAARFYNRLGGALDTQAFYEKPAQDDLAVHLNLENCRAVVEFGCGTGRFAAQLLERVMPPDAIYLGLDVSGTMVGLATRRLARYGSRAQVMLTDGTPQLDCGAQTSDVFISCYVFDLLPEQAIRAVLSEAHRILVPGGMLGVVSLTHGPTFFSGRVTATIQRLNTLSPWLTGGCRPIDLRCFLSDQNWSIAYTNTVNSYGVPSQIVAASKRPV